MQLKNTPALGKNKLTTTKFILIINNYEQHLDKLPSRHVGYEFTLYKHRSIHFEPQQKTHNSKTEI